MSGQTRTATPSGCGEARKSDVGARVGDAVFAAMDIVDLTPTDAADRLALKGTR